jgi:hypothetical protein
MESDIMPYTLWSRNRILGETDLEFPQVFANHRMGWFHPSPQGEILMPILTGTGPALRAVAKLMRDPMRAAIRPAETDRAHEWPWDIRTTTEYADLVSSVDELESMGLQVRDQDGALLNIDHVGVDDTEFKKSFIPKRFRRRLKRDLESKSWQPAPKPFPRYQIQVYFAGSGFANAE